MSMLICLPVATSCQQSVWLTLTQIILPGYVHLLIFSAPDVTHIAVRFG